MSDHLSQVKQYHQATKHQFHRYARGPGTMDWATQPNPFRRYAGAPLVPLAKVPATEAPPYDAAFSPAGRIPCAPINFQGISQLLFDSLALSAWKKAGGEAWALRVNPSSGNLHPTEGYLICPPTEGLADSAVVCHYAPREHALEVRTRIPAAAWERLLPEGLREVLFVGLASIHWRESWKYGERAYRYCALDVGHALGALSVAAAGLGWQARLVENLSSKQLARLLGIAEEEGAEPEEPDCLVAIFPWGGPATPTPVFPDAGVIEEMGALAWVGEPNLLSRSRVQWSAIDRVAEAGRKPITGRPSVHPEIQSPPPFIPDRPVSLRRIIHQRRSAVAMDGVTGTTRAAFYHMLSRTLAFGGQAPFDTLPWEPLVDLVLFVHRVDGLDPGLYCLVRNRGRKNELQESFHGNCPWEKPRDCPDSLDFFLLARGDVREVSMKVSCFQDIAQDGCFSAAMIADFDRPLAENGPWFYPRLFWECGMIGQMLYLEAEAAGLRGTGIGCFFDDGMHEILGLRGTKFQDLYHFTVGGPIEDPRITTLPAYPG